MQICKEHWEKLRAAIEKRGLSHLVANSGEQAFENIISELSGENAPHDPLMSCNWMIHGQALERGGLYLMGQKEDGTAYCPICEAISHGAGDEKFWIDGPAEAELTFCREQGLVPNVQ